MMPNKCLTKFIVSVSKTTYYTTYVQCVCVWHVCSMTTYTGTILEWGDRHKILLEANEKNRSLISCNDQLLKENMLQCLCVKSLTPVSHNC